MMDGSPSQTAEGRPNRNHRCKVLHLENLTSAWESALTASGAGADWAGAGGLVGRPQLLHLNPDDCSIHVCQNSLR